MRYQSITKPELLSEDSELKISLSIDKKAGALIVTDNGIGMTRKELVDNLGTIARSGTKAFLDKIEKEKEGSSLIGQFGVGFYSAFMVADRVEVISRKAGGKACSIWQSKGGDGFTIEPAPKELAENCQRGTIIKLYLKKDAKQFLEAGEIERVVHAYSDHISFPIMLLPSDGTQTEEPKQINKGSALWTRSKSEISNEDYTNFYKQVAVPFDEPSYTLHYHAEGRHEYSVLLFIPTLKPFDLYDPTRKGRIRLYVRRVFITDNADLLPPYLRFIRGVIDSQDVPLNISREMLQNNPIVASIKKAVTNRVLSELKKCAEKDKETHEKIWETFGPVIKEGLYEDPEHRDDLFEIARFRTTKGEGWRSLKDYVADMHEKQTAIYYLAGESLERLRKSPQLEGFKERGIEVLLLADSIDNFWISNSPGFDKKLFQSLTQGETDLSDIPYEGKAEEKTTKPDSQATVLMTKLKETLGDNISDVRISSRLVQSPACLVAPSGGLDRGLDKILSRGEGNISTSPVLEINLDHEMIKALGQCTINNMSDFEDLSWLIFDQARILEGDLPADPAKFSERLNRFILGGIKQEDTA